MITNSEIDKLEGEQGNFQVTLKNNPRFIDPTACTGCGLCSQACPVTAINEFDCRLSQRSAAFIPYAQAVPLAYSIDRKRCIGCGLCEKICLAGAVQYDDAPRETQLNVGAVVLATGNRTFDPSDLDTYRYNECPNVITSLEFERILNASGPYMGHLMRPYDREEPRKIAWIQCVGSRSLQNGAKPYCSSVCCMYAVKEAVIAKEHAHGDLDTAVFFMDMRTYGKEFEQYYERASLKHGVRFIRSRVHSVDPVGDGDLKISYIEENGGIKSETFDLVVLSTGLEVSQVSVDLANKLGVDLNENRFAKTDSFKPVATSVPGIYVCGALQGPKDIPQSVTEASAAAALSGALLSESRWSKCREIELPEESNVKGEPPRIGVFVCHCGINISGVVDVPAVRDYARSLPYVVYVEDNLYTCSQDTQIKMAEVIREQGINRVVVAACTPKTHEPLFQETLQNAGLNKYLFEMANIRNQDSWVHNRNPHSATEKAKDLVRMAVAKAGFLESLPETELSLNPVTLIIGGGVAGLTAAENLADQGYKVHLVERSAELGGQANFLYKTWKGEDIKAGLDRLIARAKNHPNITAHLETEVVHVDGFIGNFSSVLRKADGHENTLEHGVAIIATGGEEYKPDEYLYGSNPAVVTHLELDRRFSTDDPSITELGSAVFIQCVGSRQPDRPYCSRVCCTHTVESALELKRRNPEIEVYVLYRDMRTYGEREELYNRAREQGVIFIRYDLENKPVFTENDGSLQVEVHDPILGSKILLRPDLVTLATAVVPSGGNDLASLFKISKDGSGFFTEAHAKLRPVDFATDGVFLCGLAHYPKSLDESVEQALAAAGRASACLAAAKVMVGGSVAEVNPAFCSRCGMCVEICPFGAAGFTEEGYAAINAALCKGCGLCTASCRSGALTLKCCDDSQIMAMIDQM